MASSRSAFPADLIWRDMFLPFTIVVAPSCIAAVIVFGLSWLTFFPLFAASSVAVGYGAILHYLALELGMRPVLIRPQRVIRSAVARRRPGHFLRRVRLMAALPLINLITGLVVAALTSDGGGGGSLRRRRARRCRGRHDDLPRVDDPALQVRVATDLGPLEGHGGGAARRLRRTRAGGQWR